MALPHRHRCHCSVHVERPLQLAASFIVRQLALIASSRPTSSAPASRRRQAARRRRTRPRAPSPRTGDGHGRQRAHRERAGREQRATPQATASRAPTGWRAMAQTPQCRSQAYSNHLVGSGEQRRPHERGPTHHQGPDAYEFDYPVPWHTRDEVAHLESGQKRPGNLRQARPIISRCGVSRLSGWRLFI